MKRAIVALAGALLAAGCVTDRVTLLNNEDGSVEFAVAEISDPDGECVISRQLSEQKLGRPCKPKILAKMRKKDTALVQDLPRPVLKVTFSDFEMNSSEIPADQLYKLDLIREDLKDRPAPQIEVLGFTDTKDDEEKNRIVSERRARGVAEQLRSLGFTIAEKDIVGRGEFEARVSDPDDTDNPVRRKVEVIIR